MSWTDEEYGLVWCSDWAFDFEKMVAYRGQDIRNHNIRMKECGVEIRLVDNAICTYREHLQQWMPFAGSEWQMIHLNAVYTNWLNNEIEKIVL